MDDPYKILKERREIQMKEAEFNELMEEWTGEIEKIAGQPDNGMELTYEETQKAKEPMLFEPRLKPVDKAVDNPSHYSFAGTTVEEMLEKYLTHDQLIGWFRGSIIKYRMRAFRKGDKGSQDIAKADQYQKFYDEYVKRNTP